MRTMCFTLPLLDLVVRERAMRLVSKGDKGGGRGHTLRRGFSGPLMSFGWAHVIKMEGIGVISCSMAVVENEALVTPHPGSH